MQLILPYLKRLKKNNNREWFAKHKSEYDSLRQVFLFLIDELIQALRQTDDSLAGVQAKDCVFRIYRDIRYSHDKTPYKPHFSAWIVRGGRKSEYPGYYLHVAPGGCFLAVGIWNPDKTLRMRIRRELVSHVDEFLEIIHEPDLVATFGELQGERLKRVPMGFSKDFEEVELLKMQDYLLKHDLPDSFFDEDWVERAAAIFRVAYPFNRFFIPIVDEFLGK